MPNHSRLRSFAIDLARGAVAGAAATWTMGQVTTWLYEHEDQAARDREDRARGGGSAYVIAARKISSVAGIELSDHTLQQAGTAIHWVLGMAAGAGYGVARKRWPALSALKGLAFGAAFFLVVDEIANAAFGLTPGPLAFPWQAHARGLGGHLTFGAASELVLESLDRVA